MPQLHFYVPQELAQQIRERAQSAGVSTSLYIANLVKRELAPGWPEGYFEQVIGGWQGEPLTRPEQGEPEVRDFLDSGF